MAELASRPTGGRHLLYSPQQALQVMVIALLRREGMPGPRAFRLIPHIGKVLGKGIRKHNYLAVAGWRLYAAAGRDECIRKIRSGQPFRLIDLRELEALIS